MTHARHALSPLDERYASITEPVTALCSEFMLFKLRTYVMIAWLQQVLTLTSLPVIATLIIDQGENSYIELFNSVSDKLDEIASAFSETNYLEIKQLEIEIMHDTKAVEYFIQKQMEVDDEMAYFTPLVHFGCTSEDVNNLAYALMLKQVRDAVLLPKLEDILNQLTGLATQYANIPMLGRTHGQPATPTTVGKEFANFAYRLNEEMKQLSNIDIKGKLGGAVGNLAATKIASPEVNWIKESKDFVVNLHLSHHPLTTQIEPHDYVARIFSSLLHISVILKDLSQNCWQYISQDYFKIKLEKGQVGSSVMPQKINPIDFENAEGNLKIFIALSDVFIKELPVSRLQRDLSDSTVLRNIGMGFGYVYLATHSLSKGLSKIIPNEPKLAHDLNEHWEVLAEAIQTLMRAEGIKNSYEKLKALTQGKDITRDILHQFIREQSGLSPEAQDQLCALTPATYLGYAPELAHLMKRDMPASPEPQQSIQSSFSFFSQPILVDSREETATQYSAFKNLS